MQVVLAWLAEKGVADYDRNRGYFLSIDARSVPPDVLAAATEPAVSLYDRIAEARLDGKLSDSITESDMARQFDASRNDVRKALLRAQNEGWIEKEAGYGWRFLPLIDSLEAYDDMYWLRVAIEPACILNPKFKPNLPELQVLRAEQELILTGNQVMMATEIVAANSRFHETIVSWSGNQFAVQTLRRLNRMRRLAEYRQEKQALPRKVLAQEHLTILDAIESGDNMGAASLLRSHIDAARRKKAIPGIFHIPPSAK